MFGSVCWTACFPFSFFVLCRLAFLGGKGTNILLGVGEKVKLKQERATLKKKAHRVQ